MFMIDYCQDNHIFIITRHLIVVIRGDIVAKPIGVEKNISVFVEISEACLHNWNFNCELWNTAKRRSWNLTMKNKSRHSIRILAAPSITSGNMNRQWSGHDRISGGRVKEGNNQFSLRGWFADCRIIAPRQVGTIDKCNSFMHVEMQKVSFIVMFNLSKKFQTV